MGVAARARAEAERRAADEGERRRVKAAEAAAAREAPRETRHHYPIEDDGAIRARRAREVHLGIRDAGPHALATGYTGSDFVEEDNDPHAPADLQAHFEETAVLWDRVRRELDKLPIPLVEEPTGKELYHQGYDPWDFKCYDLSCLEGRNLTYTPPPGVVVRAGGKREFDNEGPNVHESLRMLGGKPATELREFPEVVAKRRKGEKPYMDDDDEAGAGDRGRSLPARIEGTALMRDGFTLPFTRDITLRALDVLAGADRVLAEDTRVTRRLLDAHGIRADLQPYHDHNGEKVRPQILADLAAGARMALVSDAGTPLVSDPGWKLAHEAAEAGAPPRASPRAQVNKLRVSSPRPCPARYPAAAAR